ncbi:hypothetical protein EYF80_028607 [Liparis tanakae]|uniref:Uncharacterized protein n=1 Tax=Liparis tanakae TaxID=230148 RepID=A0A4Z2H5M4_9TELE|nr:hypothetical protein EYF80_028607 [Liparis tanakae]
MDRNQIEASVFLVSFSLRELGPPQKVTQRMGWPTGVSGSCGVDLAEWRKAPLPVRRQPWSEEVFMLLLAAMVWQYVNRPVPGPVPGPVPVLAQAESRTAFSLAAFVAPSRRHHTPADDVRAVAPAERHVAPQLVGVASLQAGLGLAVALRSVSGLRVRRRVGQRRLAGLLPFLRQRPLAPLRDPELPPASKMATRRLSSPEPAAGGVRTLGGPIGFSSARHRRGGGASFGHPFVREVVVVVGVPDVDQPDGHGLLQMSRPKPVLHLAGGDLRRRRCRLNAAPPLPPPPLLLLVLSFPSGGRLVLRLPPEAFPALRLLNHLRLVKLWQRGLGGLDSGVWFLDPGARVRRFGLGPRGGPGAARGGALRRQPARREELLQVLQRRIGCNGAEEPHDAIHHKYNEVYTCGSTTRLTLVVQHLVVQQADLVLEDLVLEDLLLDSPQRALHLLPPGHHVLPQVGEELQAAQQHLLLAACQALLLVLLGREERLVEVGLALQLPVLEQEVHHLLLQLQAAGHLLRLHELVELLLHLLQLELAEADPLLLLAAGEQLQVAELRSHVGRGARGGGLLLLLLLPSHPASPSDLLVSGALLLLLLLASRISGPALGALQPRVFGAEGLELDLVVLRERGAHLQRGQEAARHVEGGAAVCGRTLHKKQRASWDITH